MPLQQFRQLVQQDWDGLNQEIVSQCHSHIGLVNELSDHLIQSGGKRLRPLLVLLGSHLFNYQGSAHIKLAAAVEFLHTATLLHDDVVDHSDRRRGRATANHIWGNQASILVGDFIYSRAFQLMVAADNPIVMAMLADTTNQIAEGEVLQLVQSHDIHINEQDYLTIIRCKTAILFAASAQIGALLSQQSADICDAMHQYGLSLGNAFQLVDDALDYCSDSDTLGKNVGDDLAEGKVTLPLILTYQKSSTTERSFIEQALQEKSHAALEKVLAIINKTGAITATYAAADQQAQQAIDALAKLPESPYKSALIAIAEFAVAREH